MRTHSDESVAKLSAKFSRRLRGNQPGNDGRITKAEAIAVLRGTHNSEMFPEEEHFITADCDNPEENGLHAFLGRSGQVRVVLPDGRHYRDYQAVGEERGPVELTYEAALEIARATDYGDQIDEYSFEDGQHLFFLDDASTLVVDRDGTCRRVDDE